MSLLPVDAIRYKIEMENFNTMVVDHMVPVRFPRIICPFSPLSCFIYACLVLSCRIFFDLNNPVLSELCVICV